MRPRWRSAPGTGPGLVTILVGEDPASEVYVRNKIAACREAGMESFHEPMPATSTQREVLEMVDRMNADDRVDGILVQAPLPAGLDFKEVLERIDPAKDVDGFHPLNVGRLVANQPGMVACTPKGVMELLDRTGVEIEGANAVVVGRSDIVGKPVALLLLHRSATVTVCHSRTRDLPAVTRGADILIAAVGRPEMITGDMGEARRDGHRRGRESHRRRAPRTTSHFPSASEVAGAITPVPGGVGPMTIAMLLRNTVDAATARLSA